MLDRAAQAFVISELPAGDDRYTFVHALIQRTLYNDLSAARAGVGSTAGSPKRSKAWPGARVHRVGELARHWFEAAQTEDAPKAFEYNIAAGDDAQHRLAPDEAVRWFTQALELVDSRPEPEPEAECGNTLIRLGTAQRLAGESGIPRDAARRGAARPRARGHRATRCERARRTPAASRAARAPSISTASRSLNAALEAVGDAEPLQRARLLGLLAMESMWAPDADVNALLEEALQLTADANDPNARLFVLARGPGVVPPAQPRHCGADCSTRRRRSSAPRILLGAPGTRANGHRSPTKKATPRAIRAVLDEWHQAVKHIGEPALVWAGKFSDVMVANLWDDLDRVEPLLDDSLRYGVDTGQPDAFPIYAAQLATLRAYQGRAAEICDVVAEVTAANPLIPGFRSTLALLYAQAGRDHEARTILDDFAAQGVANVRVDIAWGSLILSLAQAASLVEHPSIANRAAPVGGTGPWSLGVLGVHDRRSVRFGSGDRQPADGPL